MLILKERLSGFAGGAGSVAVGVVASTGATSSTAAGVSTGGAVEQPASTASSKGNSRRDGLITEPDAKHVDLCRPQSTAQDIEFVEVVGRAYAHTVIGLVVDRHALDLRFNTMQAEFGTSSIRVDVSRKRSCLQYIKARFDDRFRFDIRRHIGFLFWNDDFEVRQHVVKRKAFFRPAQAPPRLSQALRRYYREHPACLLVAHSPAVAVRLARGP